MDPAEEIVTAWLNEKGFFTLNNYRVGLNEIDILTINPRTDEKFHIEMHIPIKPLGALRARGPIKYANASLQARVEEIVNKKFLGKNNKIRKAIEHIFGTRNYKDIFILGKLHPSDPKNAVIREFAKYRIKVFFFADILKEIKDKLQEGEKVYMSTARRYIQLIESF